MADKRPRLPKNTEVDALVAARMQRDMEGFVELYDAILRLREKRYASEVLPMWKRIGSNVTEELRAIYNEIQDANGVPITRRPIKADKLRNMKRNIKRLASLQAQLVKLMGTEEQAKKLSNNLAFTYADSYYFHAFGLEQATQVAINVPNLTAAHVMGAIINPWLPDGRTYGERLRANAELLATKMENTIVEAIGNGWDWNRTARRIQEVAGEGYYNAVRLARTEMNRAANQGASHLYMQNADILDGKRWNATLDSRTAPKDAANDGKIYDLAYDTPEWPGRAGERIPNHPQCRCKWTPVISALGVSKRERIARGNGDSPTNFGERIYTKARTYREYAQERSLPDLDERLANDNPAKYLRRGEDMSAYNGISGIVKTTAEIAAAATVVKPPPIVDNNKPPATSWADQVKERLAAGINTEQDAVEVGNLVRLQIEKDLESVMAELQAEIDKVVSEKQYIDQLLADGEGKVRKLREAFWQEADLTKAAKIKEEYEMAKAEQDALYAKWQEKRNMELSLKRDKHQARAEAAREAISQVRPVGKPKGAAQPWEKGSNSDVSDAIDKAYEWLPTEWVEASLAHPMEGKKVKRGYYSGYASGKGIMALSDEGGNTGMKRVAIHELGHRMEHLRPEIRKLEYQFYQRRTAGEQLQWLGGNYAKSEKARFDNFQHKYMGKDYGNRDDSYYELLSMGMESLFWGRNDVDLTADVDYYNFILGVLIGK
ncbi:phage putative head morphogenesis protein, SPP1 gp7 family [Brevibacillus sp. CF112]|uniref:minor capsid protein n=1 Tax=Brevibacillus TaxID=55080 RepID=UPI000271D47F|nr:minor capsid protein [Brevibacillus sp. CF112]EJL45703.1 phage putative head morphogenesis protein, SPP1 gp7 family [Brevibacillus sp. CF112]